MKLAALVGEVTKTHVDVPGDDGGPPEKVEVHYRPGKFTIELTEKMREAQDEGWGTDVVVVLLEELLVWWDLDVDIEDANGNPTGETRHLETTAEDIKKIPLSFLNVVIEHINLEARPSPLTGATSDDSLPPEVSQDEFLTGTPSSESPSTTTALPGSSSNAQ